MTVSYNGWTAQRQIQLILLMNKHAKIYEYELCTSFYNRHPPFVLMSGVQALMVVPFIFVFLVSCRPSDTYNLEVVDAFLKNLLNPGSCIT